MEGRITSIDEILDSGKKILECEIVDVLAPELKNDLILIGGRSGKGGGAQRIPIKITAAMHRSGRRFTTKAMVVVGNEDGIVGLGRSSAVEGRDAMEKALKRAKMSLIKVTRGCGSWECECGGTHSIPYKTVGKSGSVQVILMPAPKGLGLVADDESKKVLTMAGIKDVWVKTKGNTQMRINLITAVFNALKNLYIYERGAGKEKIAEVEEEGEEYEEENEGENEEKEEYENENDEDERGAEEENEDAGYEEAEAEGAGVESEAETKSEKEIETETETD
jgi:small subunit ribosomal protein S5